MAESIGSKGLNPQEKYKPQGIVSLSNRTWPDKKITTAPTWCSVDLRDGNQALINPMNYEQKLKMYNLLLSLGFKEIEIGFPSAAEVEYTFARSLIENDLIPDDVTVQVLCQAKESLIRKTFDSIKGAKKAIFHLYNSTSTLQREVVFKMDKEDIIKLAIEGTKLVKKLAEETDTEITFQYSPESFTGTELEFSKEICEEVMNVWQPTPSHKMIINLPSTVEMTTPNVYADQIEWFVNNVTGRENYILSLHTHNDRGCGVAATELGLLAGADRVEGTLFGNGERTGNVDIITLALNLYTQGLNPNLDISEILKIRELTEECTEIKVPERHPYAGDLVFTAFSGSHQDAIKKGIDSIKDNQKKEWKVPYLTIDPKDIGRTYEAIIRINSQSGKGGVAYIMENEFNCVMPKAMHPEVSQVVQKLSDKIGKEVSSEQVKEEFNKHFVNINTPYEFLNFFTNPSTKGSDFVNCCLTLNVNGEEQIITGDGNGPIDACKNAIEENLGTTFALCNFSEHSLEESSEARAISYIQVKNTQNDTSCYGVGVDANIEKASIKAMLSALNRTLI